MLYTVENITLNINEDEGEFAGDCSATIPFGHKRFFKDCDYTRNENFTNDLHEPIFEHEYGEVWVQDNAYMVNSPDLIIMYLEWLLTEDGKHEVEVNYSHPFWAIHDFQHVLYDTAGCTIYVDADVEKIRLEEAFDIMKKEGYAITYEIVEEVETAYNQRFDKTVSFEEYLFDEYGESISV